MNIPLINSLNVNDINTSLIAIRKNMQKTSSGTEKLQDVDVNVNIAHNSLYCAADSTIIKGATLFQGCSIKVLFTSAITGSDSSTPLVINYNDVNIPVKTGKNGTLVNFVAYNTGSSFVYCQAYTTLELLFDGTQFVIMGNPVVISNSDYTIYTDGSETYNTDYVNNTYPTPISRTFTDSLVIDMSSEARFCFFIQGQGINGASYGGCIIWGYGAGTSVRYHYTAFGNFQVAISDKKITVTCSSGQNVLTTIFELLKLNRNYTITAS